MLTSIITFVLMCFVFYIHTSIGQSTCGDFEEKSKFCQWGFGSYKVTRNAPTIQTQEDKRTCPLLYFGDDSYCCQYPKENITYGIKRTLSMSVSQSTCKCSASENECHTLPWELTFKIAGHEHVSNTSIRDLYDNDLAYGTETDLSDFSFGSSIYKSSLLQEWGHTKTVHMVRLSVFNNNIEKAFIIFNGAGTDKNTWLNCENRVDSNWNGDFQDKSCNIRGGPGNTDMFVIKESNTENCTSMYLTVTESSDRCNSDLYSYPNIIYSPDHTSVNYENASYGHVLAIFVLVCPDIDGCLKVSCTSHDDVVCVKWTNTTVKVTNDLAELENIQLDDENVYAVSEQLYQISKDSSAFLSGNVNSTVQLVQAILMTGGADSRQKIEQNIVTVMNNVLDANPDVLRQAETDDKSLSKILTAIDTISERVNLNESDFSAVRPHIAIFVRSQANNTYNGIQLLTTSKPGKPLNPSTIMFREPGYKTNDDVSSITIPKSLAAQVGSLERITFYILSDKLFYQRENITMQPKKPNSFILAASVPGEEIRNLKDPIVLEFYYKNKNADNPVCSFWNDSQDDPSLYWSNSGCVLVSESEVRSICTCSHLTNFALLMDIYQTGDTLAEGHRTAFSVISYIGCTVSLVSVILTVASLLMFKKMRSSNPSKILINLCIALGMTNIMFVLGEQHYTLDSAIGCKAVAALLHYFLFSCFLWMSIEAFSMYLALIKIFNVYISHFILKACIIGWGLPLAVVGVTLGVNTTENYGRQPGDICWISPIAFYGSVLGPVALMILFNFVIFVMVSRRLTVNVGKQLTKSTKTSTQARLRRVTGVLVVLGLTWVFAFLTINDNFGIGLTFQYLFTIFNSLQGLFVFIFYVALNNEIRKLWRKKCEKSNFCNRYDNRKDYYSPEKEDGVTTEQMSETMSQESSRVSSG